VAVHVLGSGVLAAIAVAPARETCKVPLEEIDGRPTSRPATSAPRVTSASVS
jgi:hypothetical protein